jgi:hypothetical protein
VGSLWRLTDILTPTDTSGLSVRAEMPIVSEEYWDHFVSFRFPSMKAMKDLYQSDKFQEENANRIKGLEATLAVVSKPEKMPPKPKN